MKKHGFTLIELLIVVAIIAILAAIAVPNFLEAQTRSKVARVKSDMRTIHTAFMAYFNDYMKAPPDGNDWNTPASYPTSWQAEHPGQQPDFPLMVDGGDISGYYVTRYLSPLTTPVAYITNVPHDSFTRRMPYGYDTRADNATQSLYYAVIASIGPDTVPGDWMRSPSNNFMALAYDATNGTKSRGDIWRGMVVLDTNQWNLEYPFDVK